MIVRRGFTLPIYGVPYEIVFVTTNGEARDVDPEFNMQCSAWTRYDDDTNGNLKIIFRYDVSDEGVCAHECVHLADRIWITLGYKLDAENDEPNAYLVGHLMSTVMEVRREYEWCEGLREQTAGGNEEEG